MKTSTERMIARKDGPIGWMQFNNPARHNAVSVEMWKSVPEIMTEFKNDDQIRVVVVSGAGGKAFVSGADISEFAEKRSSRETVLEYNRIAGQANAAIIDFPKPTIAMIQGYCVGGGLGLALCCDLRLAAEDARFAVPAAKLGLGYAFDGIKRLVQRRSSIPRDSSTRPKRCRWGWSTGSSQPLTSKPTCAIMRRRSAAMRR